MLYQRVWLQRRRLAVVALVLYLAGLSGLGTVPEQAVVGQAGAGHLFAGAGALAFAGVMLTAALLALAPALRRCAETLALAALVVAVIPTSDMVPHAGPLADTLITVCAAMVLYVALYGGWWSRVPFRFDWTTRRRFVAHCPQQAVWARLVPNPAQPSAHYSGLFVSQEPVDGHPNRVLHRSQTEDGAFVETLLDIEASHPPHHFAYAYHSPDPDADTSRGRFCLTITPYGKGSLVCFAETVERLTLPTALDLWFDDLGGETRAAMLSAFTDPKGGPFWRRLRAAAPPVEAP